MTPDELDRALTNLHRDRSNAWDARTAGGAPHKPFVLLALCDIAEQGQLTTALVPFDGPVFEALGRSFQSYFQRVIPGRPELWMPLWHLRSDHFWIPSARDVTHSLTGSPGSMLRLQQHYAGALVDGELLRRLLDPLLRETLRALLLGRYFDELTRDSLLRQIEWNRAALRYGHELLDRARAGRLKHDAQAEALLVAVPEPVRTQGFRIAVVTAYEHRCAACGLRLQTPDGLSVVQAAHIKPWAHFHDDRVNNGLGLCATCHWCFDNFLWTAHDSLAIRVARVLRWDQNSPAHLESLESRRLLVPAEANLHPDPESLRWHREQARIGA